MAERRWLTAFLSMAVVITVAFDAWAKRDFFVQNDVQCDDGGERCTVRATKAPLDGELRLYYPSGIVQARIFYANGVRNGKYRTYFSDGELRYSGEYRNGKTEGVLTTYYNNGKIREETHTSNGVREGVRRLYYPDGRLFREERYEKGKLQGNVQIYYPDGQPLLRVLYADGVAVSGYCLTPKGQRLDFTAQIETYRQSGKTPCDAMMQQAVDEAGYE